MLIQTEIICLNKTIYILKCEGSYRTLKDKSGYRTVPCTYSITYKNYPNFLQDAKRVYGFDCAFCNKKTLRIFQKKVKTTRVLNLLPIGKFTITEE